MPSSTVLPPPRVAGFKGDELEPASEGTDEASASDSPLLLPNAPGVCVVLESVEPRTEPVVELNPEQHLVR